MKGREDESEAPKGRRVVVRLVLTSVSCLLMCAWRVSRVSEAMDRAFSPTTAPSPARVEEKSAAEIQKDEELRKEKLKEIRMEEKRKIEAARK